MMIYIALYGACLLAGLFLLEVLSVALRDCRHALRQSRGRAHDRLAREYRMREAERHLYLSELAARYRDKADLQ